MGSDDFKFDSETVKDSIPGANNVSLLQNRFPFLEGAISSPKNIYDPEQAISKNQSLVSDLFFSFAGINGLDFRKVYPYSFSIVEEKGSEKNSVIVKEIFLPLPPNSFVMDVPSATQLTVTLDGVVEESNGAPLRSISISGSTGIVNKSSSVYNKETKPVDQPQESFFTKAADYAIKYAVINPLTSNNVLGQAQNIVRDFGNATQRISRSFGAGGINFYPLNEKDDKVVNVTGFYWFHSLLRFFEYYLHIKKSETGKDFRLGFNIYKDKQFFYVTLNNFRWQKIAGSIEYNYSINLTAWKKNSEAGAVSAVNIASSPVSSNANIFSTVRNAISSARQLFSAIQDIVYAADQDIYENFFTVVNQLNLLAKDSSGSALTASDFPADLGSGSGSLGLGESVSQAIVDGWATLGPIVNKISNNNYSFSSKSSSSSPLYDNENKASKNKNIQKNILPVDLKKNPYKYLEVLDKIEIGALKLNKKSIDAISDKVQKARDLTVYDLIKYRQKIQLFSKAFSDLTTKDKILSPKDILISSQLNNVILSIDQLINYMKNKPKNLENDYYSYYVDYAVSNGLNLTKANSKFFVPFPVGATMESLSLQYLGDPGRWVDIAALNGLKAPYIDEEGFFINLKANGSRSTILLATRENLYIGQVLTISSDAAQSKKIKITEITEFSKAEYLISFEGDLQLSAYKIDDNAKVQGFLPGTVNSSMLIAIPSQAAPINQDQVNLGPGLDQLNSVAQLSKVDFLLTDQGDFSLSPNGDIKKSAGFTNLSQAAKIKLFTAQGSMLHRPNFGNPLRPGISIANFNAKEYLIQLNKMFGQDERFTGILLSNVNVKGPAVDVNLLIGTKNTGVNLPVTTTVPIINT